jgi:hypothetical protein
MEQGRECDGGTEVTIIRAPLTRGTSTGGVILAGAMSGSLRTLVVVNPLRSERIVAQQTDFQRVQTINQSAIQRLSTKDKLYTL